MNGARKRLIRRLRRNFDAFDLHDSNAMVDKDYRLVLTDPVYGPAVNPALTKAEARSLYVRSARLPDGGLRPAPPELAQRLAA